MMKILFGALAAFALASAAPAFADDGGCKNCPGHKKEMAQAEKKGDDKGAKEASCHCAGEGKECKCGEACKCPHCSEQKAKKDAEKKTT